MRSMHIPQYEGLSLDDIMKYLKHHQDVFRYLPDTKEIPKLPKKWVCDAIFTVVKENFG